MKTRTLGALAVAIALLAMVGFATPAAGDTINYFKFDVFRDYDEIRETAYSQIELYVAVPESGDRAFFYFHNDSEVSATIGAVYFDDLDYRDANGNVILGDAILDGTTGRVEPGTTAGVSYQFGNITPPNVPGWDAINPSFGVSFAADTNGNIQKGVDPGEVLVLSYAFRGDKTYDDLINAMLNDLGLGYPSFRIGLHVQRIGSGDWSDSFISVGEVYIPNKIEVVPEPATMTLLGLGLAGIAFKARRRRA